MPTITAFLIAANSGFGESGSTPLETPAARTVKIYPSETRGAWEGWGTSLGWWANMVGARKHEHLYLDLFFTGKSVRFLDQDLPGLNLNIVRYNVGGGGRKEDASVGGMVEQKPPILPWDRDIEGFWINPENRESSSTSWDWERDAAQRSVLRQAVARGVDKVEFYSNAPMWWMMDSQSSAGGTLLASRREEFAVYLAAVVAHAEKEWQVKVDFVSPFNEPSANWWHFPKNQEGMNLSREDQATIIALLRQELDARGLQKVGITASEENSMQSARETWQFLEQRCVSFEGEDVAAADLVAKVNVHSYFGIQAMRDNTARANLRQSVGNRRLWTDEFGDSDGSGMVLAQTIMEDLTYLRPSAWIYWQALDPWSTWGLVTAPAAPTRDNPDSGSPSRIHTKYYVFAQFTRFLCRGDQIFATSDPHSVAAYDPAKHQLKLITLNDQEARTITYDLDELQSFDKKAAITETRADGSRTFAKSAGLVVDGRLILDAAANSVYSVVLENFSQVNNASR